MDEITSWPSSACIDTRTENCRKKEGVIFNKKTINYKSFPNELLYYNSNSLELKVTVEDLRFKIDGTLSAC